MDNPMDNFNNDGRSEFNRPLGNVNPYASRYGTQNPQDPNFYRAPQPQDPRVARQPMPNPYAQNPQQPRYATPPQNPIPPQQPQYFQAPNQISNQDFEEQFDYQQRNGQMPIGMTQMPQMPMQQIPMQQPVQPQPKKKGGFFSFMNKKQPEPQPQQSMYAQQFVNLQSPQTINDVKIIIDMIKSGDTAFIDFSKVNEQECQRMLDFLSGAAYALGGIMQAIGQKKFVITPPGTGIRGQLDK